MTLSREGEIWCRASGLSVEKLDIAFVGVITQSLFVEKELIHYMIALYDGYGIGGKKLRKISITEATLHAATLYMDLDYQVISHPMYTGWKLLSYM